LDEQRQYSPSILFPIFGRRHHLGVHYPFDNDTIKRWGQRNTLEQSRAFQNFKAGCKMEILELKKLLCIWAMVTALMMGSVKVVLADYEAGAKAYQEGKFAIAFEEWLPLAQQGNLRAQLLLGFLHRDGEGVAKDFKEAMKWFLKAATQGNALAQSNLSNMYQNGLGVLQDFVIAHMWSNIAGANGSKSGAAIRVGLEKKMTSVQIAEAQRLARVCMVMNYKGCVK
jgi:hypothetical protein